MSFVEFISTNPNIVLSSEICFSKVQRPFRWSQKTIEKETAYALVISRKSCVTELRLFPGTRNECPAISERQCTHTTSYRPMLCFKSESETRSSSREKNNSPVLFLDVVYSEKKDCGFRVQHQYASRLRDVRVCWLPLRCCHTQVSSSLLVSLSSSGDGSVIRRS